MESAAIRRAPPLPGLIQLGLIGLLIALAAVAWVITSDQMSGMDAGPGTDPGTLGFFIGVWVVMMAAMMFPSIAPMVVMHARIQEGRRERGQPVAIGATALFVGGYLVAWTGAGLIGYGIYQLGRAATGDVFSWDNAGPYLAGGHHPRRGGLPAHSAEGRLSAALPQPADVPDDALAARATGRAADGSRSTAAGASAAAGR